MIRIHLTGLIFVTFAASLAFGKEIRATNDNSFKSIIFGWELLFAMKDSDRYACDGIFVGPRVFIAVSRCVQPILDNLIVERISIDKSYDTLQNSYSVNISNIYSSEDLNRHDGGLPGNISVVITNEPFNAFEDVNNQTKFVELVEDIEDVDYLKCFVLSYSRHNVHATYCNTSYNDMVKSTDDILLCESVKIDTISVGSPLVCASKQNSDSLILVGITPGRSKYDPIITTNSVYAFEKVLDLRSAIQKIMGRIG